MTSTGSKGKRRIVVDDIWSLVTVRNQSPARVVNTRKSVYKKKEKDDEKFFSTTNQVFEDRSQFFFFFFAKLLLADVTVR